MFTVDAYCLMWMQLCSFGGESEEWQEYPRRAAGKLVGIY